MGTWPDYETIIYDEQENGVAWVTLNRPERLNSFNSLMQRELRDCWSKLRRHDDVRCIVFHVPFRCTRMTESKSSSDIVKIILSRKMPALFTSTSSRPYVSIAVSIIPFEALKSETSS